MGHLPSSSRLICCHEGNAYQGIRNDACNLTGSTKASEQTEESTAPGYLDSDPLTSHSLALECSHPHLRRTAAIQRRPPSNSSQATQEAVERASGPSDPTVRACHERPSASPPLSSSSLVADLAPSCLSPWRSGLILLNAAAPQPAICRRLPPPASPARAHTILDA